MRSNEERVAAVKRRVEQLEARSRRVRSRVAAVSSVAACLALIVCLSFAMPGITGRLAEWSYGAYGAAGQHLHGQLDAGVHNHRPAGVRARHLCDHTLLQAEVARRAGRRRQWSR